MDNLRTGGSGGSPEIKREPWWKYPPKPGQTEADLEWGFLVEYENGDIRFIEEVPTEQELHERVGCWIKETKGNIVRINSRRETHSGM